MNLSTGDLAKVVANPFYCLPQIDPIFIIEHEPLVSEDVWVQAGVQAIKETGAELFLKNLLENLKGNYPKG